MRSAPFPWIALAAYAVLWFAPRINRWIDRTPPKRPSGRVRGEILRVPPSRELERRDG